MIKINASSTRACIRSVIFLGYKLTLSAMGAINMSKPRARTIHHSRDNKRAAKTDSHFNEVLSQKYLGYLLLLFNNVT